MIIGNLGQDRSQPFPQAGRSDILREALKRQLPILRFEQLRRQILPFAEARGYLTDEDANKAVS